jgi:hypothetical protein
MSDTKSMMILPENVDPDNYSANMPPTQIRTETIFNKPRSINNNSATFRIENTGILDFKSSRLVLQANSTTANDDLVGYVCNVGISGLVQTAILKCGKVICTSQNFGNYFSIVHNSFTSNNDKTEKDRYLYGTFNGFKVGIDNNDDNYKGISFAPSNTIKSTVNSLADTNDKGSSFSIPLSVLFPGFITTDIPLYLLNQNLEIEIVFTPENTIGDRAVICDNTASATDKNVIAQDEVMLIENHHFFSDMRMEQIRDAYRQNGYSAPYNDLISTRDSLTAGTTNSTRSNHQISGAGKMVDSILCANPVTTDSDNCVRRAFGKYGSDGCLEKKTFNLVINNKKQFPIDVTNMNVGIMNAIYQSMYGQNPVEIPYSLQCKLQKVGVNTDRTFNSRANYADIMGQMNYFGCKLDDVKVGNTPITLELLRHDSQTALKAQDIVSFLTIRRQFTITPNGSIEVSYS